MSNCPFCDYAGPNPILADYGEVYAITPLNPVTPGHILLIPKIHVANFTERPGITAGVAQIAAKLAIGWPDANLITSKGVLATQTVDHLHFHLIPRRERDGLALPWSDPD